MAEWDYAKVYGDDYITRDWEEVIRIRKPVAFRFDARMWK